MDSPGYRQLLANKAYLNSSSHTTCSEKQSKGIRMKQKWNSLQFDVIYIRLGQMADHMTFVLTRRLQILYRKFLSIFSDKHKFLPICIKQYFFSVQSGFSFEF